MADTECPRGIGPLKTMAEVRTAEIDPETSLRTADGQPMSVSVRNVGERETDATKSCAYYWAGKILGGRRVYCSLWCPACGGFFAARIGPPLGDSSDKSFG